MKTYIFYGVRRSGNHFIISNILQNYKKFVHINDIEELRYEKYLEYKKIEMTEERIDRKWIGFKDSDCVLISLENREIDYNELSKFDREIEVFKIILIRNPYNNLSSCWRVYNKNLEIINPIIGLWKKYADIFLNDDCKMIKVVYDKYCDDSLYYESILNKFNVDKKNINKNKPIMYTKSSFMEENLQRKCFGSLKDCIYKDDEDFIKLFDEEIDNKWNMIIKLKESELN